MRLYSSRPAENYPAALPRMHRVTRQFVSDYSKIFDNALKVQAQEETSVSSSYLAAVAALAAPFGGEVLQFSVSTSDTVNIMICSISRCTILCLRG